MPATTSWLLRFSSRFTTPLCTWFSRAHGRRTRLRHCCTILLPSQTHHPPRLYPVHIRTLPDAAAPCPSLSSGAPVVLPVLLRYHRSRHARRPRNLPPPPNNGPCKGRFVRENQPDDDNSNNQDAGDVDDSGNSSRPASGELLCRIPEETLFQLQQVYEALEESNGINSGGGGGGGSRRKSTSSAPSLMALIASSSAAGGSEEDAGRSASGSNGDPDGSVRTPEKTTSKVCTVDAR